jgi:hypothetical protein
LVGGKFAKTKLEAVMSEGFVGIRHAVYFFFFFTHHRALPLRPSTACQTYTHRLLTAPQPIHAATAWPAPCAGRRTSTGIGSLPTNTPTLHRP